MVSVGFLFCDTRMMDGSDNELYDWTTVDINYTITAIFT